MSQPGDTVVVYGAGPVGLFAAYSSVLKSASKVMLVDRHPDRLALAEKIGAIPIDDSKTDPVQAVLEQTDGKGADRGCECVGYQAHDPQGKEQNNLTLNRLIESVKFTGGIGVVGVYVPSDPGSADDLGKQGKAAIDYGKFWFKGQHMGTGQCPVKRYNRKLCNLIAADHAQPSFLVSHELPLDQGAGGLPALRRPRSRLDQGRPQAPRPDHLVIERSSRTERRDHDMTRHRLRPTRSRWRVTSVDEGRRTSDLRSMRRRPTARTPDLLSDSRAATATASNELGPECKASQADRGRAGGTRTRDPGIMSPLL